MKFILCEDKFLLNETPSFILEERFILDEEILLEAQATLKQLVIDLNKLDTLLPDLQTALDIGLNIKILDGTPLADEKLDVDDYKNLFRIEAEPKSLDSAAKEAQKAKEVIKQVEHELKPKVGGVTKAKPVATVEELSPQDVNNILSSFISTMM